MDVRSSGAIGSSRGLGRHDHVCWTYDEFPATPFFLAAAEGFDAVLGGELDIAAVDTFPRALERADLAHGGDDVVIDASPLRFVDHRALLALEQYARQRRADVVLYGAGGMAARLVDLLGLERVSVA